MILIVMATLALSGLWAYGVMAHNVFPASVLREFQAFFRGVPGDERSLWVRFLSANTYLARGFPASHDHTVLTPDDFIPMRAAEDAEGLPELEGMRVANPTGGPVRYFVIYGSFAFPDARTNIGMLAIDSTGTAHRGWHEEVEGGKFRGLHIGMAMSDDGVLANTAKGILNATAWCGGKLWQAPWTPPPDGVARDPDALDGTDWHHDVAYADGRFWSFVGPAIAAVDAGTGEIVEEIHALDLMRWAWAQDIYVMDGGTGLFNPNRITRENMVDLLPEDPFHFNKVEPLTADRAASYPDFRAGDLLINLRNNDLVAVIRPEEERFVWWRLGLTSRAHDATFVGNGIEVFHNNPFSVPPAPTIRRLDLDTQTATDIFRLDRFGMVMRQKGNFEHSSPGTPEARLLVVDDDAGRMIQTRLDGTIEVVFENGHDNGEDVVNLQLRAATEVDPETFERLQASCR